MRILTKAVVCALLVSVAASAQKQLKPGESDLYNEVVKDVNGSSFTQAVTEIDTWLQRFPDSDYRDERAALAVQAYAGANRPEKALDMAAGLISKDLNATFTGPAGQATIIRLLYNTVMAVSKAKNPTAAQLAAGSKAATLLVAYDTPLPNVPAEQWAEIRKDMRAKAEATLLYIAMLPGIQAMAKQPPDCAAATDAYSAALRQHPESAAVSYELGRALNCEAKKNPEKESLAVYEFVRAAVLDPTLGNPGNDPKKIQTFAESSYAGLHGSSEGLEQLRLAVKQSPMPPENFQIKTAAEIAEEKQADFDKDHPQLALWMKIKAALSGADGEQYFESQLKDTAVPALPGTLIEAKPACRPKELMISVSQPNGTAEIVLKLDKALTGKPEINVEVQFEGVPSAFTKEPFLLTMSAETNKVRGLKIAPCTTTPVRKR